VHTGLWWGDLKERDRLGDRCVDGMVILQLIFNKWYGRAWTGGPGGRLSRMR
jgi:hypothetical protein